MIAYWNLHVQSQCPGDNEWAMAALSVGLGKAPGCYLGETGS